MRLHPINLLAIAVVAALPATADPAENHPRTFEEVVETLVDCQAKHLNVPAGNRSSYIAIRTSQVCAPRAYPPAHDEGIEAVCMVEYRLNGQGEPDIETSMCNAAFHGDFPDSENAAWKLKQTERLYEAVSARATQGWRFEISNDLEAENLGKLQQPFEFLVKKDGPHMFEPVDPDAMDVGPDYDAGELVAPLESNAETGENQ